MHFDEAIRITRKTLRNETFRQALTDYEQAVIAGRDIAQPLEASGVFSPLVIQMLAVGQESGQLEDMLQQLADVYDREVTVATQRLTSLLEPVMVITLGLIVGFIVVALFMPMVGMIQGMSSSK